VASTLLNIARCHEREGKLAQAWADYQRAVVLNQETPGEQRRRTLAELAAAGSSALEGRLSRLAIEIDPAPAGLTVTRDGVHVPSEALGAAVPVDPGEHRIAVTAPGYQAAGQRAVLAEGETRRIALRLVPTRPAGEAPPGASAPAGGPGPVDTTEEHADPSIPAWVWGVGGLGMACIGTAIAFRVDAAAAEERIEEHCGSARICRADGDYDPSADNARKDRGFGLFVGLGAAGVVGLGVAAVSGVVVATSSSPRASVALAPSVSRHGASFLLRGSY